MQKIRQVAMRLMVAVGLTVGLAAVGVAIASPANAAPVGLVTLYRTATVPAHLQYLGCQPTQVLPPVPGTITGFTNEPLYGCQVVLLSPSGQTTVLCAGSGTIPAVFQQQAQVLIRPGVTQACIV
jgi:hypothetical protein